MADKKLPRDILTILYTESEKTFYTRKKLDNETFFDCTGLVDRTNHKSFKIFHWRFLKFELLFNKEFQKVIEIFLGSQALCQSSTVKESFID